MAVSTPPSVDAPAESGRRPKIYYGYYIVGIAFLAQLISAGSQTYVAGVFLKPMTLDLDWSRTEFTLAQTIGRFIMAFFGIFVGTMLDRGYARRMMFIGTTILGAGLLMTSYVTELWQWMLLRGLLFTVGAAMVGNLVVNVTLSKWWVERRGRMIGISAMGVSMAGVVLPLILTPVVDEYGWRVGWRVLALIAMGLIYPVSFFMRSSPEEHGLHPDGKSSEEMATSAGDMVRADFANSLTRSQALRTTTMYQIVVAFGVSGVGLGTMLFTTIPFVTDAGFSTRTGALMLSFAVALPAALVKPLWGSLMDYVSPKLLAALSFVGAAIGMAVIVLAAQAHETAILAAGFVLVGIGLGGQIPIQEMIWASYFGRRYLGSVRSAAMPLTLFFGAGGPLLVQVYFDKVGDYDGAFYAVGAAWVLAAGLVMLVRKPKVPEADIA
ncbi:MAG: MFS transporter [Dehalococcoidia bacterium]|nr:MFS transporter [Dehalococcoidia bacterium]